jgi:2-phospho-L-lactate transferase/gluconeogenesis factor (CofD/UPF0052 family)
MKIVIFSGGTGSVQLQTGLYEVFNKDCLDYTIITNLGDNGLSTGVCRQVMDGKIMGPSDLRKNQILRAQLHKSCDPDLLRFLETRFDSPADKAEQLLLKQLIDLNVDHQVKMTLSSGINAFFSQPAAMTVDYTDFSVSNIIYSGLAKLNNYSLDAAGDIFENILGIPKHSVISNTDTPMYLTATTESGFEILDEGDIVSWDNPNDKIVRCGFLDGHGHPVTPLMNERSLNAIKEADMIIFSTGTQWSSLIPTYISTGFRDAIDSVTCPMYLIMNSTQDKDVKGVSGDEMLNILNDYLPLDRMNIVSALDGDVTLVPVETRHRVIKEKLMLSYSKKHDGGKLVYTIFKDYFDYQLNNDVQVFDYDDTLVARGDLYPEVAIENIRKLSTLAGKKQVWISTGNTVKAIKRGFRNINLLADGGVNRYFINEQSDIVFMKCLDEKIKFTNNELDDIIVNITSCGIDVSKIQNRGSTMVSVKPIAPEYREPIRQLLQLSMPEYSVKATGRTTIDVYKPELNKTIAADLIFHDSFTFFGDEGYEGGNDYEISMIPRCNFYHVKSIKDTCMYLTIATVRDDQWN